MKIIRKENLKEPKFFKFSKYILEHDNIVFDREFIEIGDTVCALIYNKKSRKYVFVKQFRPGMGDDLIELVGGLYNQNSLEDFIREEVLEETGYIPETITLISTTNWVPAYSTEKLHMFYIVVSEKENNGGGLKHENEFVEVIEMSKKEIHSFDFQKYSDAKTLLSLSLTGLISPFKNTPPTGPNLMENPESRVYGC